MFRWKIISYTKGTFIVCEEAPIGQIAGAHKNVASFGPLDQVNLGMERAARAPVFHNASVDLPRKDFLKGLLRGSVQINTNHNRDAAAILLNSLYWFSQPTQGLTVSEGGSKNDRPGQRV
jgi:hypothetical protein